MHCVVYKCLNRQNSAAKENGIHFFYLPHWPKDVKKRKSWVNAVDRTDWSPHEIFSNFIMFGALVDGWQCQWWPSLFIQRKIQNWLDLQVINFPPPLPIRLEKLQVFLKYSWQRSCRKNLLWTHSSLVVFKSCQSRDNNNLNKPLWWTYNISY